MRAAVHIGVISDTHGLLRPQAIDALRGSDYILHAGDIGKPEIIEELRRIAPVHAIRGNVDREPWARQFPETDAVEIGGVLFYLIHDANAMDLKPEAAGFQAVISGHSHKPLIARRNEVLFFNPGSAGPRRFSLPVTVGRLKLQNGQLIPELVELKI